MQYFKGIDGLRGLAAISVIIFHVMPILIFKLGWIGVDLFFVISGFLITNILINNKYSKNYFLNFYARRALRIFPLYFLIVIPIVTWIVISDGIDLNIISYIFYFQNFTGIIYGYVPWLNHTWSLAIEE